MERPFDMITRNIVGLMSFTDEKGNVWKLDECPIGYQVIEPCGDKFKFTFSTQTDAISFIEWVSKMNVKPEFDTGT